LPGTITITSVFFFYFVSEQANFQWLAELSPRPRIIQGKSLKTVRAVYSIRTMAFLMPSPQQHWNTDRKRDAKTNFNESCEAKKTTPKNNTGRN